MWSGTTSDGSATIASGKRGKSRSIASTRSVYERPAVRRAAARERARRPGGMSCQALPHAAHPVRGDEPRAAVRRVDLLVEPRAAAGRRRHQEVHGTAADADDLVRQVQVQLPDVVRRVLTRGQRAVVDHEARTETRPRGPER